MTDSVMDASPPESKGEAAPPATTSAPCPPDNLAVADTPIAPRKPLVGGAITQKFVDWRAANPDAVDAQYVLQSELEAAELLLELAGVMRELSKAPGTRKEQRDKFKAIANHFTASARGGRGIEAFTAALEQNQAIEVAGVRILPPFTLRH